MALPPFDIAGGLPVAVARGLSVAGLLSTFGALAAPVIFLPPATTPPGWKRLVWLSLLVAALGVAAWLWLVSGTLADGPGLRAAARTVPTVLRYTLFGHVVLLRLALLAAIAAGLRWWPRWLLALIAAAAVLTQSVESHAFAMHPGASPLALSEALHLLAAGAWLGGLLPLLLLVRAAPLWPAAIACRRFGRLGGVCVVVLAATALVQASALVGSFSALTGTAYGLMALTKLGLFLILLGFAAANRFRRAPALLGGAPALARIGLARSIAGETAVGLLIVLAAGVLTSLPPPMHMMR